MNEFWARAISTLGVCAVIIVACVVTETPYPLWALVALMLIW